MRQTRSNFPGFSLIELLIVIAVIGIFAAMAAPRYGSAVNRYRVDAAARRIAADLAFAQANARSTSASRVVLFDVTSSGYTLVGQASPNLSTDAYSVQLGSEPYRVSIATVSFGGNPSLSFNGYGVPSNAGSIQIRSANAIRTVTLEGDNGTVSIQ